MKTQTVFIAGSRSLSKLSKPVKERIERIIAKGFTIEVGDANGMDKAVQSHLSEKGYANVIVFCMENVCRNNIGKWKLRRIPAADPARRDFTFYATKDKAMLAEADYGLMLWDGKSRGTLTSIIELVRRGRPAVVYLAPEKRFVTIRDSRNLEELLSSVAPDVLRSVEPELKIPAAEHRIADPDVAMLF
jgi:hypothetical protein